MKFARVETIGPEPVPLELRTDRPDVVFWVWFAAGINLLAIPVGGSLIAVWGLDFWQALAAAALALVTAMALLGVISVAGTWGGTHTLALSRAPFGLRGAAIPTLVSFLSLAGFEAVMEVNAVYAVDAIAGRFGIPQTDTLRAGALAGTIAIVALIATVGHAWIIRTARYLAYVLGAATLAFLMLEIVRADWDQITRLHTGTAVGFSAACVLLLSIQGTGWWNAGADYSRYVAPGARAGAVIGWSVAAAASAIVFILLGLVLTAQSPGLEKAANPIAAVTAEVPSSFLVPYLILAIGSIVPGAVINYYSGALNAGALGIPMSRVKAALLLGLVAVGVDVYILFVREDFFGPLNAGLFVLGALISAWAGVFIADMLLLRRREGYTAEALTGGGERFGRTNPVALVAFATGSILGLGTLSSTEPGFAWLGFVIGPSSELAQAAIGVPLAIVSAALIYVVGTLFVRRFRAHSRR